MCIILVPFIAQEEYHTITSIGNLDWKPRNVNKTRIELGYALAAYLPLLRREPLEQIAIKFSE